MPQNLSNAQPFDYQRGMPDDDGMRFVWATAQNLLHSASSRASDGKFPLALRAVSKLSVALAYAIVFEEMTWRQIRRVQTTQ
ncbi:hypothetical protein OKW30_005511 [Paraburkholderia sp. Clong3]|uniref:hypothetical protein n=1 Tax=unclassified Paraburkholderia TaxID=2615204 RepID=UPI003D206796